MALRDESLQPSGQQASERHAAVPRFIGPYRIRGVLGRGAMGIVYRGVHPEHGQVVAIKTVQRADYHVLASVRREINALLQIQHPGVVRIVDQGLLDGLPWYAMELLQGHSLQRLLDNKTRPTDHALNRISGAGSVVETLPSNPDHAAAGQPAPSRAATLPNNPERATTKQSPLRTSGETLPSPDHAHPDSFDPTISAHPDSLGPTASAHPDSFSPTISTHPDSFGPTASAHPDSLGPTLSSAHPASFAPTLASSDDSPHPHGTRPAGPEAKAQPPAPAVSVPLPNSHTRPILGPNSPPPHTRASDAASPGSHTRTTGAPYPADALSMSGPAPEASPLQHADRRATALRVVRDLCHPLAFLHGAGIVHRDLKPDNIVVRDNGAPVLVDLGIASRFSGAEGREELFADNAVMGTCLYMAPEQIRGELVDARADLYALGCILYQVLTGRPPFMADSQREVLRMHLFTRPEPPSALVPRLHDDLDRLVMQLLAKRPADRIGYALDVSRTLARVLGPSQVPPHAPTPAPYLYRPVFTGRQRLLLAFDDALDALQRGESKTFVFSGESGVGKTRLALEMARRAALRDIRVVTGQARALASESQRGRIEGGPLHLFRSLLCAIADACQEGGAATTASLLGNAVKVLAPYELALATVPGIEAHPDPLPLDPQAARARVVTALVEVIGRFAAHIGQLLFFTDDLQWADELSLQCIKQLASLETPPPLLLIGSYRAEEANDALLALGEQPTVTHHTLQRLDEEDIHTMVASMLALRQVPPDVVEALARTTSGNPFFVAEYLRAAVDVGWLWRDVAGQWRLGADGRSFDEAPLPDTLRALIGQRLNNLPEQAWDLVAAAAVLGRSFDGELLDELKQLDAEAHPDPAAAGIPDEDALVVLQRRQILEEVSPERWSFVHDKLREVAYDALAADHRRMLHHNAATLIGQRDGALSDRQARLAHHWSGADEPLRAAEAFMTAARDAQAHYANEQAAQLFRSADREARRVVDGEQAQWLQLSSREHLADLLVVMGEQQQARDSYAQATDAIVADNPISRARLTRKVGKTWELHQQHQRALSSYELAQQQLGPCPESAQPHAPEVDEASLVGTLRQDQAAWWYEWVQLGIERAQIHYWAADVAQLDQVVEQLSTLIATRGTAAQRARFYQSRALSNVRRLRYRLDEETVDYARASLVAFEMTGDRAQTATARFFLAVTLICSGALDEADEVMNIALDEAEQLDHTPLSTRCLSYATMLARLRGEVWMTNIFARKTLSLAERGDMAEYIGVAQANLGWIAWRNDQSEEARRHCHDAVARWASSETSYRYPFQWLGRLVLLATHTPDAATAPSEHARALLDTTQQRLPDAMTETLESLLQSAEPGPILAQLIELARNEGYL